VPYHTSYCDIRYRILSHRIIPWRLISYYIPPNYTVSYRGKPSLPYHTSHYHTVTSEILFYHTVSYHGVLYRTISHRIIQYHTVESHHCHFTHHTIILWHLKSYFITPYHTMASYIVLYPTESYSIIPWHTILSHWPIPVFWRKTNATHTDCCTKRNSPCRRRQLRVLPYLLATVPERLRVSAGWVTVRSAILTRAFDSEHCVWIDTVYTHSA